MPNRFALSLLLSAALVGVASAQKADPIARKLPPPGDAQVDPADRADLEKDLAALQTRIAAFEKKGKADTDDLLADVKIYEKAVRYALLHNEFYGAKKPATPPKPGTAKPAAPAKPAPPRGVSIARDHLKSANARLTELEKGTHSWTTAKGALARGYTSTIDGSAQPYGLEIPEGLDLSKPVPLYIWLHGRGDTDTDLYFIAGRQGKKGEQPHKDGIHIHPYGRGCVGFKSAGEIDVLEAIESVKKRYKIDDNRIVLAGFSMGGAGTWHIGAHYTDRFVVVQPGAGFIDVKRYQNLDPAAVPPTERIMWGVYDVPDYVHNLFNTTVLSYSGENDKQRASARIMADVYKAEGRELPQFIGPKVEHKYLPLPELLAATDQAVKKGRDLYPKQVTLQTRTLRYNKMFWVEALSLEEHWQDSRIDAKVLPDGVIEVTTKNVAILRLRPQAGKVAGFKIDGKSFPGREITAGQGIELRKLPEGWTNAVPSPAAIAKHPGLQGPIDDAFMAPFLFVAPTGKSANAAMDARLADEMKHQQDRWRALMRGDLLVKNDRDVTDADLAKYHVVCWGTPESNSLLAKMAGKLPVQWAGGKLTLGGQSYDAATHYPAIINLNPLSPGKYVVLNSGLTFREAHDGTNSQQNPKLGDWAIIDTTTPASAAAPGKVVAAGFFDESWKPKPAAK